MVSVTALRDAQNAIMGCADRHRRPRAQAGGSGATSRQGACSGTIFNSANFSSIATNEKGVIQLFNVGAERMLGYTAADVLDKITPADASDPQELMAHAQKRCV